MGGRETDESREQWLEDIDMKASLPYLSQIRPGITPLLSSLGNCCVHAACWASAALSKEADML